MFCTFKCTKVQYNLKSNIMHCYMTVLAKKKYWYFFQDDNFTFIIKTPAYNVSVICQVDYILLV